MGSMRKPANKSVLPRPYIQKAPITLFCARADAFTVSGAGLAGGGGGRGRDRSVG